MSGRGQGRRGAGPAAPAPDSGVDEGGLSAPDSFPVVPGAALRLLCRAGLPVMESVVSIGEWPLHPKTAASFLIRRHTPSSYRKSSLFSPLGYNDHVRSARDTEAPDQEPSVLPWRLQPLGARLAVAERLCEKAGTTSRMWVPHRSGSCAPRRKSREAQWAPRASSVACGVATGPGASRSVARPGAPRRGLVPPGVASLVISAYSLCPFCSF